LRSRQLPHPRDNGLPAFHANIRAHARQFLGVHKSVLENRLRNDRDSPGLRHQRHELSLQIGGEAGMFLRNHVHTFQFSRQPDMQRARLGLGHFRSGLAQFVDQGP